MTPVVSVRDLEKRYGDVVAVRDVAFEVSAGQIFGLLGPNGAGKTTTLESLLGLRQPDAGTVSVASIDMRTQPLRARPLIGAVLQTSALQDKVTPRQALRLFAAFHRRTRAQADSLLEQFALGEKADATFDSLSGGQRQRLALALAFLHEPRVLVLDEPTAGLDPASRRDLHDRITACRTAGCAVVLSTHDMAEAQRLCDRLAIIDHGRIVATGKPEELIARAGAASRIVLQTSRPLDPDRVAALPGVDRCETADHGSVVHTRDINRALAALTQHLTQEGNAVRELQVVSPTLEDAFLALTGRTWTVEGPQP